MERVHPDQSKLSALGARRVPEVSLALSSSRIGGVMRDPHNEPILPPTVSSAQPGPVPTQQWNRLNTTTHRGPRSSRIPVKNMYGSLSSAIGPSKDASHVNYTVSEDATESNLLNKLSRMLAILDESILVRLVVVTNTQAYERQPNYQTAHDVTPSKKGAMPKIPHISRNSSISPGLGYPLNFGQVAETLRSAFVARQQIARINAKFASWANPNVRALTKRQMWYGLAAWDPVLDEQKIRSVADEFLRFGGFDEDELVNGGDYLRIVAYGLYDVSPLSEVLRMFDVLVGQSLTVKVADLFNAISSCDDHEELTRIIRSIDRRRTGSINYSDWFSYFYSLGD